LTIDGYYNCPGKVYVASLPGYGRKIGHTENLKKRFAHLRATVGRRLVLEHEMHVGYARTRVERWAHAEVQDKRIEGEWFDISHEEAVRAVNMGWWNHIMFDTPDILAGRCFRTVIDRGIGPHLKPRKTARDQLEKLVGLR